MKKILLVIAREYLTRVKKPSFWILTIVVPILIAALYAIPIYLAIKPVKQATVLVVDETTLFHRSFEDGDNVVYRDAGSLAYAKQCMAEEDTIAAIIHIPARETTIPGDAFLYYLSDAPSSVVVADVERQLQNILRNNILLDVHNISAEDYDMITNTRIKLHTKDLETGRDAYLDVKIVVGLLLAILVLLAIVSFGSQVMRGVTEEKSSRIVEVIVCSVRPFQLMMGKVVGVALVGLTQFLLWIALSGIGLGAVRLANHDLFERVEAQHITEIATKGEAATQQMEAALQMEAVPQLIEGLASINFGLIAGIFLLYFIFGYLLYASLFAACGALADNDTDSQQFTLPLIAPLFLCFLCFTAMVNEPSGTLATWLSIIPFTSPVAMLFRLPFGVPTWQMWLSLSLLIASFPLCTYLAAKIYRSAILRYGQKTSWKSLFKMMHE
ncbi:MAG: ABC transporter permease [Bacteroidales bacterium]|nr:ABC transporter permease [Bacteroidales bacterium]